MSSQIEARGIEIGEERGETKLAKLMSLLFSAGRTADAQKAAEDSSDGKQMTVKYVEVLEPMNGYKESIKFLVPINTTFILNE